MRRLIGCVWCVAQLLPPALPGQEPTGSVGWVGPRDERFRRRFTELLLAVPSRDHAAGWQLARDLGRPAVPLLWEMLRSEQSSVERRLPLLAAAMLAGGPGEDERLFVWLEQSKPMLEERVLAAILLALGPQRTRPAPDFWSRTQGPQRVPEQILGVALRLAAARFPEAGQGIPPIVGDDPGVAGATAYVGLAVPSSAAAKLWQLKDPARHADLFWRGALLGELRRAVPGSRSASLLERAREVSELTSDSLLAARRSAMLLRARCDALDQDASRPDWRMLQAIAGEVRDGQLLAQWLGPAALPRDEEPARLAVAYALARAPEVVVEERAQWSGDARISGHVALTLAFRIAGAADRPRVDASLPNVREWYFVRWAAGTPVESPGSMGDDRLDALAALAASGRLTPDVLRASIEDTLWRWGSHPGIGLWREERLLVRDIVLAGSNAGGSRYQPHLRRDQRYFPTGLDRGSVLYEVAVAVYEFLGQPVLPVPPELRIR
jgi:hypothetical protein